METELKLSVRPDAVPRLQQHPLLTRYATSPPRLQVLSGIYFDTPNFDLRHADAGLRVRKVDQDWIQTLKAGGTVVAGLHQRNEWESKVAGPTPDLEVLRRQIDPKSQFARLIKDLRKRGELVPAFTTSVQRTVWDLRLPTGDEVECAIDQGSIDSRHGNTPVSELELELKSGDPARLFDLALELQSDVPMQIGNLSKADRGYEMAGTDTWAAVKASALRLSPRMSIGKAFQAIVMNCVEQIQANQPGVTLRQDIDSLHQMRVGLRRLRSAFTLFEPLIPCPESIQEELLWLGSVLGPARDWDVLHGSTLPGLHGMVGGGEILQPVLDAAQNEIRIQHERVANGVGSPRYTRLLLTLCSWIQGAQWNKDRAPVEHDRLNRTVAGFADDVLRRQRQRLMKRGRHLHGADPATRHRLRIAAKRARYATEFFASLFPEKAVRRYVRSLALLQDELGLLNDAAVAKNLLRELEASQPQIRVEAACIWGYLTCRLDQDDPALVSHWKRFKSIPAPQRSASR